MPKIHPNPKPPIPPKLHKLVKDLASVAVATAFVALIDTEFAASTA